MKLDRNLHVSSWLEIMAVTGFVNLCQFFSNQEKFSWFFSPRPFFARFSLKPSDNSDNLRLN